MATESFCASLTKNAQKEKLSGCLKTEEIVNAEHLWLRLVQKYVTTIPNIDLMKDGIGILRVCGRIPNYCPIFVPKGCILDRTLVTWEYRQQWPKLEQLWIPQLRVFSETCCPRLQQMSPIQSTTSTPTNNSTIACV